MLESSDTATETQPASEGYRSLIVIKEGQMNLFKDLLNWMNDVWMPDNGYDSKAAIMRNTREGHYEIMAKPIVDPAP